jgi:hypothetical protein
VVTNASSLKKRRFEQHNKKDIPLFKKTVNPTLILNSARLRALAHRLPRRRGRSPLCAFPAALHCANCSGRHCRRFRCCCWAPAAAQGPASPHAARRCRCSLTRAARRCRSDRRHPCCPRLRATRCRRRCCCRRHRRRRRRRHRRRLAKASGGLRRRWQRKQPTAALTQPGSRSERRGGGRQPEPVDTGEQSRETGEKMHRFCEIDEK